ncbi:hypothetical protein NLI96_g7717 [Meripilus lineatus]|uniref:Uncharacterized protein n=1 Tax=Meripilus lineatus TaxID=2056292 RepID=A0AAD5UYM1_9APHY|nr:hypothetical protein NLI96_g7717 [Physisporinus lineatus]
MRPSPPPLAISGRELDEKLELINQLSLEDEWYMEDPEWPKEPHSDFVPYGYGKCFCPCFSDILILTRLISPEEYDDDACEASVYDPGLFTSPSSPRSYTLLNPNRYKPLPAPPPSTPVQLQTPYTTPLSSPRADSFALSSPSTSSVPSLSRSSSIISHHVNRSRTSSLTGGSRSPYTHSAYPSISSTLSNLEEQDIESERASSFWPMDSHFASDDLRSEGSQESTILAHTPMRKSSREMLQLNTTFPSQAPFYVNTNSQRKSRPTTPSLTTSASSPALRNLAALASIPASPIHPISPPPSSFAPPRLSAHHPSRSSTLPLSLLTDLSLTPFQSTTSPSEINPMLASRWSLETTAPNESSRRAENNASGSPKNPPNSPKMRKRDRLLSFISRSRAGSVGKSSSSQESAPLLSRQGEADPESNSSSRRSSRFTGVQSPSTISLPIPAHTRIENSCPPPLPIASTSSSSSSSPASTTTSCSVSTIATPVDGDGNSSEECHSSGSGPESMSYFADDYDDEPPQSPILPLPSPHTPAVSFLYPRRQTSSIPFLSAFNQRRKDRRKRQLVISDAAFLKPLPPLTPEIEQNPQVMVERKRMEAERERRRTAIIDWCKKFGELQRIQDEADGVMVVSWKNWEHADQACRVQATVSIKNVGTLYLAWRYKK